MAFGGQIIRLVLQVVPVLLRAIPAAYAKAIQNAAKNNGGAATAATTSTADLFRTKPMSKEEALQVLNIEDSDFTKIASEKHNDDNNTNNLILERYERYMNANEVKRLPNSSYNTGSFYLQSKIYHAKETLLRELQRQQSPPPPQNHESRS